MHDKLVSRRIDALHQCFLVSFYYAYDYCQMHRDDASEKGLVCVKRNFSAMYDQTVTIERIVIHLR